MSSYENTKVTTKISEVTSKIKDIKQEWENEKLTLSYDGWLTDFGTDVDFNSLKIDRDCKYLCEDNSCCQLNIKQEEIMNEFNSLININSRVDKYYNIIFNA